MGVQGERCHTRVVRSPPSGRRDAAASRVYDHGGRGVLDRGRAAVERQVGALRDERSAVGIRADRPVRAYDYETGGERPLRGQVQDPRCIRGVPVQGGLHAHRTDASLQHHAGLRASAAAHAVRTLHTERVPLLHKRVLHDGRRVPVLPRLTAL